jgi:LAO/AO transport system kinase
MEELVKDAFIRPSASGETLGGVARKTRESISLCEACGFDTIILKPCRQAKLPFTAWDFFLLLKIAGAEMNCKNQTRDYGNGGDCHQQSGWR